MLRSNSLRAAGFALALAASPAAAYDAHQRVLSQQTPMLSAGASQNGLAVSSNTTLTVPTLATCAYITVEGAQVRRTSDGTSATTTNGTLFQIGAQWADCGPLSAYKFTAVSGSPTLDVEYFYAQ